MSLSVARSTTGVSGPPAPSRSGRSGRSGRSWRSCCPPCPGCPCRSLPVGPVLVAVTAAAFGAIAALGAARPARDGRAAAAARLAAAAAARPAGLWLAAGAGAGAGAGRPAGAGRRARSLRRVRRRLRAQQPDDQRPQVGHSFARCGRHRQDGGVQLSGPFVEGAPAIGAGELVDFRCDDGSGEWVGCGPGVVVPGRVGRESAYPVPGRDVLRQARVAGVDQLQHCCRPRRAAEVTFEENPEAPPAPPRRRGHIHSPAGRRGRGVIPGRNGRTSPGRNSRGGSCPPPRWSAPAAASAAR